MNINQATIDAMFGSAKVYLKVVEQFSPSMLAREVADQLQAVKDAVDKVVDAQGRFLLSLEELSLDENMTAVKARHLLKSESLASI